MPAFAVILFTLTLDAMGVGLILPILPSLLRELDHTGDIAFEFGLLIAAYAAMQFVFAPILGALADRFGRRPVLLLSVGGGLRSITSSWQCRRTCGCCTSAAWWRALPGPTMRWRQRTSPTSQRRPIARAVTG